jgi:hypothetical protein
MEMPDALVRFGEGFVDRSQRLGRWVQRGVLAVLLFVLYYVGFGITRVFATVFGRRYLKLLDGPKPDQDSYWLEAEGYGPSADELHVQF